MKRQIRLTESDLHDIIKGAVRSIIKEYTDSEKERIYGKSYDEDDFENFNEQPTNNLVNNEARR